MSAGPAPEHNDQRLEPTASPCSPLKESEEGQKASQNLSAAPSSLGHFSKEWDLSCPVCVEYHGRSHPAHHSVAHYFICLAVELEISNSELNAFSLELIIVHINFYLM